MTRSIVAPPRPRRIASAALAGLLALVAAAPSAAQQARLTEDHVRPFKARFIGPGNMSGRITALAVPRGDDGRTIFVGTAGGGVWKTVNRGTTWQPLWNDQDLASIGDVALAPSNPEIVWVGTGERNSLRSQGWGDGVHRSTDGGRTWRHMGLADSRIIGRVVVHPDDPNVVFVAALGHLWGPNQERGIYRSDDGGESWERILFVNDTTGFVDLKMDPSNPEVMYAAAWHRLRWGGGRMEGVGAGSGIYKTTDGGRSWTRLTDPALANGLPTDAMGRIGLDVSPTDPNIVYAVIQVGRSNRDASISAHGGVFRSDDAGASWTRVHDISAVPDYFYNEIYVDPQNPEHVWVNGTYLYRSRDGGRSFTRFDVGNVHVDHHAFWINPRDSDHWVLATDGGLYLSYDGGENFTHEHIPVGQFYEINLDTTKVPYHVCGGLQDNGVWCGPSRTRERAGITNRDWYAIYGGDGFHSAVDYSDPNIRYAESQFGNISRWDVRSWERVAIQPAAEDAGPESGHAFRWDWNTPFVLSRYDPTVLYLGGNFLFKLTNRGDDWEIPGPEMTRQSRWNPEPMPGYTSYGALHSVAESPIDRNVLWTGSGDGLIWTTSDGGSTWSMVTDAIPVPRPGRGEAARDPRQCFVSEIEPSHHDARTAYVTFDCHMRDDYRAYVYRTTNSGRTWTDISGDLPDGGGTYVVREDAVNPRLLFVGTERGLWVSNEGGGHWVRMRNGLPAAAVRDMDFAYRENELVVGTMGRSIFVIEIGALRELTPEVLAGPSHLFPIEPARQYNEIDTYESFGDDFFTAENPPTGAVITYYLREAQSGEVRITIRDAENEVVQTLTGSGSAGVHQVTWNLQSREPRARRLGDPTSPQALRQVLPGTYTAELRVGETTHRQPIVVERGWVEEVPGRIR